VVLVGTVAGLAGCNFAVISELGVGVHLFDGSSVVMAPGAADAARFSRHRLERDHGRGSARRAGPRERRSASTARAAPWSWSAAPG